MAGYRHRKTPVRAASRLASIAIGAFVLWAPFPAHADCPTIGTEAVTVTAVEDRLQLRLADGRAIRLVGLDPAGPTPEAPDLGDTSRSTLAALLLGKPLTIEPLSATPDRWGRFPAFAFLDPPEPGGLAARAVGDGLGRYRVEPAVHPCHEVLLAREDKARRARLGLWADPYYAVLGVEDEAAFVERSGTNVVIEGRLTAVLPGPFRTKLRFATRGEGSYGGHSLSATILPRTMKTFEAKRVIFRSLIGRTLRLRGLLDLRFGPQIELAGPDDVEILDGPVASDSQRP